MGLELEEEVVGLRRRGQAAGCIQNGAVDGVDLGWMILGGCFCLTILRWVSYDLIWVYGFNMVLWVLYSFVG